MNKRQMKITFLALITAAIAGLATSARAQDTTAPATPGDQAATSKFNGPVTAVDTNAMTFTVNDQALTVTGDSQIMRNGKTATLADVVVGEPARGSYTKSADGKLDVTKVRFGKKAGAKAGGKNKKNNNTDTNAPPATSQNQ